jgi:hypothetical protein
VLATSVESERRRRHEDEEKEEHPTASRESDRGI